MNLFKVNVMTMSIKYWGSNQVHLLKNHIKPT